MTMSCISVHVQHVVQFLETKYCLVVGLLSIAVGSNHAHPSRNIKLYGRVYTSITCRATAINKIIHLEKQYGDPTPNLKYNLKACASGTAMVQLQNALRTGRAKVHRHVIRWLAKM